MKKIIIILILISTQAFSQKIEKWERISYEKQGDQWMRDGYVESFFNKQVFFYDRKGKLLGKKNYNRNDQLIGAMKYNYKRKLPIKRIYRRNPKLKKNLWETFYSYDIRGNKICEVWYWNKTNREDSIVFKHYKNKITKIKYNEENQVTDYWNFELKNEKKIIEERFRNDSIIREKIIWSRTKKGIPVSKRVIDKISNDIYFYKYNKKGRVINITKNNEQYKRFEIEEDIYGNWIRILTYNRNDKLTKKVERKIKYY